MYAIVELGGEQVKVQEGQQILVNRQQGNEGDELTLDKVLLKADDKNVDVGTPTVDNANVKAKIVEHLQDKKKIIFKKKRRKGYQKKNGHRQALTKLSIEKIN